MSTQTIKTTEGRNKLKSKMHILNEDEVPEQFMIWQKDFEDKILKNTTLTTPEKLAILQRLVDMEAQTIVSKVIDKFKDYAKPTDIEE